MLHETNLLYFVYTCIREGSETRSSQKQVQVRRTFAQLVKIVRLVFILRWMAYACDKTSTGNNVSAIMFPSLPRALHLTQAQ